jgi:hypothetical protein
LAVSLAWQGPASAWGDEGHEIIALMSKRASKDAEFSN